MAFAASAALPKARSRARTAAPLSARQWRLASRISSARTRTLPRVSASPGWRALRAGDVYAVFCIMCGI